MMPGWMVTLEQDLQQRALPDGGFAEYPGGDFRPDAAAWAVLALTVAGKENPRLELARSRLQAAQMRDGSVPVSRQTPAAIWPTALAVLAWNGSAEHESARDRAIAHLLDTTGKHWPKQADSPVAHDTALRGWPWVTETHSWVEPTALAVLALRATGHGQHPRTREAVEMLLDRQIAGSGWNYGNTRVYGKNLHPMPDATGLTLQALAGYSSDSAVEPSLNYLEALTSTLRTPYSLAWSILGLSAWERRPAAPERLIADSLDRQSVFGSYPTSHLCLLLLALSCPAGLNGPITSLKGSDLG